MSAPLTAAQVKARHEQIQQVECPTCGARPGWRCVTPQGRIKGYGPHGARRRAAADAGLYEAK